MVEEAAGDTFCRAGHSDRGRSHNRDHQPAGSDHCADSDRAADHTADQWRQTKMTRVKKMGGETFLPVFFVWNKVKDRWGSHRSFEGSINN